MRTRLVFWGVLAALRADACAIPCEVVPASAMSWLAPIPYPIRQMPDRVDAQRDHDGPDVAGQQ